MPTCAVCIEDNVHHIVTCASCDYATCRSCARRFVLGLSDPRCMACQHTWDREFMDAALGSSWVNGEYKRHRELVLFDRERAMLPATQDRLHNYRWCKAMEDGLAAKRKRLKMLRKEARDLDIEMGTDKFVADRLRRRMFADLPAAAPVDQGGPPPPVVAKKVLRGCPVDACRGFMHDDFKCASCSTAFCEHCHDTVTRGGGPHTCDANAVKAATFIVRDTKPCPTCASPIHKLGGCSQMWCTVCRTAFDWNTGQVDMGIVHNPHYVAWVNARGGEDPGAADRHVVLGGPGGACRDQPHAWRTIRGALVGACGDVQAIDDLNRLGDAYRDAAHIRYVKVPTMPGNGELDNLDLRLRYLNNEISEPALRTLLQRREKKRARDVAERQVLEAYSTAACDIVASLLGHPTPCVARALGELGELKSIMNVHLAFISARFNMKLDLLP